MQLELPQRVSVQNVSTKPHQTCNPLSGSVDELGTSNCPMQSTIENYKFDDPKYKSGSYPLATSQAARPAEVNPSLHLASLDEKRMHVVYSAMDDNPDFLISNNVGGTDNYAWALEYSDPMVSEFSIADDENCAFVNGEIEDQKEGIYNIFDDPIYDV